jgi:hypothetical protein
MSTGFWLNQDGLPLQFGTQKAIPEVAGDYLAYGENRILESYICLGNTAFGSAGTLQVPGLPLTFSGTSTPIAAGIQSMTTLFPLQPTAPITQADTSGNLTLNNMQLYIDQVDFEVLIAATAGTGGATGLAGIGLVTVNPATGAFVQVTPNAGVQIMGAATNAKMASGMHYTWYGDGTAFGTATPPTAGSWLGRVPLVTNSITPLPTNAFLSVLTTGGPYTGTNAGGLMKVRVRYNYYGSINQ